MSFSVAPLARMSCACCSIVLASLIGVLGRPVFAQNFNPNSFDAVRTMNEIQHPHADLVTVSSHRGLHALVDGSDSRVPENSLQAIGLAAQAGLEMIELDIKLDSAGVPVMSHDTTWGRETTGFGYSSNYGNTFSPFAPFNHQAPFNGLDANNELNNWTVASHHYQDVQRYFLRDTISLTQSTERISTLSDVLNYLTVNRVAMVLALDLRDPTVAAAAWSVISTTNDYQGRPFAQSTLFKIPAKSFVGYDYKKVFGNNYSAVHFQPVYNTGDVGSDVFQSEQGVVQNLFGWEAQADINVTAVEIQIKQVGGNLTQLLNAAHTNNRTGQPETVSVFSPFADHYDNYGNPEFYTTTGYCCIPLSTFYYDGSKGGQADTADNRGDFQYLRQQGFNSVTRDDAVSFSQRLAGAGLRNISYLQPSSGGTPNPDPGPPNGSDPLPPPTVGETTTRRPDPSTISVNGTYYSVESTTGAGAGPAVIAIRSASTLIGLQNATPAAIFSDQQGLGEVWAPEIMYISGRFYVYFSMGSGPAHRMYAISSSSPKTGYSPPTKIQLPGDNWAIDGTTFVFNGQRWFVWSGWPGTSNGEQDLFIVKMSDPVTATGDRFLISAPKESWEVVVGNPAINEAPEAIVDPNGQLHIVYSANGSWSNQYCLGDLRLRAGGDPTYVWDWHKANGCLFGSNGSNMEPNGWYPALNAQGPGHHTFALVNGDIANSPNAAYPNTASIMYAAVPNGMNYSWANRVRYVGAFTWYNNINYNRCCVPGSNVDTGYTPMFFEDPSFKPHPPPSGPPAGTPGYTGIKNADPSVIRQGGTYISVEVLPGTGSGSTSWDLAIRQASTPGGLANVTPHRIFTTVTSEVWAPKLVFVDNLYYIYYSAADTPGGKHLMKYVAFRYLDNGSGLASLGSINLAESKWAVDGSTFVFNNQRYFVWSGWQGDTNVEQNIYISSMNGPTVAVGPRYIISQPREPWERKAGGGGGYPAINEAPMPIVDPNGQLHIFYSANGSWSSEYCIADLRLRAGGDPTYVWDWYKSNGCEFGSDGASMMSGWDPTKYVDGPGSHSFVLVNGDISTSPPAGPVFPSMYTAVPKGTPYTWANRMWWNGSFQWWNNTPYSRSNVPGANTNVGYGLKFYEGPTAP